MHCAACRGLERRLADALTVVGSGSFLPPTPGTEGYWGDVLPCATCRDLARQLQKHGMDGQGIGKAELRMIKKHLTTDVDAAAAAASSAGDSDITRGFQEDAVRLRARIAELETDNAAQLAQRWHTCIYSKKRWIHISISLSLSLALSLSLSLSLSLYIYIYMRLCTLTYTLHPKSSTADQARLRTVLFKIENALPLFFQGFRSRPFPQHDFGPCAG